MLLKYNQIRKRVQKLLKIESGSKSVYYDKHIKTKIKTYACSMIRNFYNKKTPKEKAPCKSLSIIMLDSVIKAKKKSYPQHFWKNANVNKKR